MSEVRPDFDLEDLDELIGEVSPPEKEEKSKPKRKSSSSRTLRKRIEEMLKLLGMLLSGLDSYDGGVIIEAAPELASQLDQLAKESPRVRRFIEAALETGAWSGVVGVLGMKVVVPMAVHHSLLPDPVNVNVAALLEVPVKPKREKTSVEEAQEEAWPYSVIPGGDDDEGDPAPEAS